jgi:hypothetical protein
LGTIELNHHFVFFLLVRAQNILRVTCCAVCLWFPGPPLQNRAKINQNIQSQSILSRKSEKKIVHLEKQTFYSKKAKSEFVKIYTNSDTFDCPSHVLRGQNWKETIQGLVNNQFGVCRRTHRKN